ncbi:MAG: hypothetical protein ACFCUN_04845 [Hyphomicrobiaceae bacterium]
MMLRTMVAACGALALALVFVKTTPAFADGKRVSQGRVSGATVGGYSYQRQDSINTYGNNRTLYGSTNVFRDPMLDRQTRSGPFDHGWFFESGTGPRGGNSPYMN